MDLLHLFLAVGTVIELAVLGFVVWGAINIAYSTAQIEQTAKEVAAMANRNERMTQEILQKVYEVRTTH